MRGHPGNPMSASEFEEKFTGCTEPVIGPERARRALTMIDRFEQLADMRLFMAILVPGE
jgi:hypothetical protein